MIVNSKRRQSRIKEPEAEIRRRQPLVVKLLIRSRCIMVEASRLKPEERESVAKHLQAIAEVLLLQG